MSCGEQGPLEADTRRRSRILHLAAKQNPANERWKAFLELVRGAFAVLALLILVLFGFVWPSPDLLTLGFGAVAALTFLLGLLPAALREYMGCPSGWHRYDRERLCLGEEALTLIMNRRRGLPWQGAEEFVWVMPYAGIKRLEYDRALKRVRVIGSIDPDASRIPAGQDLPKGMRAAEQVSKAQARYVDIPMYFAGGDEMIAELEARSGTFVHPAKRADDMADLRDLPGLTPEPKFFRSLTMGLAAFCALFLLVFLWQGQYLKTHPYVPFAPTDKQTLRGVHSAGEDVMLDGCRVTVEAARREGDLIAVSLSLENANDTDVMFHAPGDEKCNVAARCFDGGEELPCVLEGGQDVRVQIAPGGEVKLTFAVRVPEGSPDSLLLLINSDEWPAYPDFWRKPYKGNAVWLEGGDAPVKGNEIAFLLELRYA